MESDNLKKKMNDLRGKLIEQIENLSNGTTTPEDANAKFENIGHEISAWRDKFKQHKKT